MIPYHVMIRVYISLLLMVCFDLNPDYMCFVSTTQYKESPHEAGFIFGDLCLISLWEGTQGGCIYWVIFILLSNSSGDKTPIVTQLRETVFILSHGTVKRRTNTFLEDLF